MVTFWDPGNVAGSPEIGGPDASRHTWFITCGCQYPFTPIKPVAPESVRSNRWNPSQSQTHHIHHFDNQTSAKCTCIRTPLTHAAIFPLASLMLSTLAPTMTSAWPLNNFTWSRVSVISVIVIDDANTTRTYQSIPIRLDGGWAQGHRRPLQCGALGLRLASGRASGLVRVGLATHWASRSIQFHPLNATFFVTIRLRSGVANFLIQHPREDLQIKGCHYVCTHELISIYNYIYIYVYSINLTYRTSRRWSMLDLAGITTFLNSPHFHYSNPKTTFCNESSLLSWPFQQTRVALSFKTSCIFDLKSKKNIVCPSTLP